MTYHNAHRNRVSVNIFTVNFPFHLSTWLTYTYYTSMNVFINYRVNFLPKGNFMPVCPSPWYASQWCPMVTYGIFSLLLLDHCLRSMDWVRRRCWLLGWPSLIWLSKVRRVVGESRASQILPFSRLYPSLAITTLEMKIETASTCVNSDWRSIACNFIFYLLSYLLWLYTIHN